MRITLEPKTLGRSRGFSDDLKPYYNPDLLLYWINEIIATANRLYIRDDDYDNIPANSGPEATDHRRDHYIKLVTKRSINPIVIEVEDSEGLNAFKKAVSLQVENMPLGMRDFFQKCAFSYC